MRIVRRKKGENRASGIGHLLSLYSTGMNEYELIRTRGDGIGMGGGLGFSASCKVYSASSSCEESYEMIYF